MAWRGTWTGAWTGGWDGSGEPLAPGFVVGAASISISASGSPTGIGHAAGSATLALSAVGALGAAQNEFIAGSAALALSASGSLGSLAFLSGQASISVVAHGVMRAPSTGDAWRPGAWRVGAWRIGSWQAGFGSGVVQAEAAFSGRGTLSASPDVDEAYRPGVWGGKKIKPSSGYWIGQEVEESEIFPAVPGMGVAPATEEAEAAETARHEVERIAAAAAVARNNRAKIALLLAFLDEE